MSSWLKHWEVKQCGLTHNTLIWLLWQEYAWKVFQDSNFLESNFHMSLKRSMHLDFISFLDPIKNYCIQVLRGLVQFTCNLSHLKYAEKSLKTMPCVRRWYLKIWRNTFHSPDTVISCRWSFQVTIVLVIILKAVNEMTLTWIQDCILAHQRSYSYLDSS